MIVLPWSKKILWYPPRHLRRCWRYPRRYYERPGKTSSWWDNFCNDLKLSEEWKKNDRMFKERFLKRHNELRTYTKENVARLRKTTSNCRNATLCYLTDKGRMPRVANSFGIGKSSRKRLFVALLKPYQKLLGNNTISCPYRKQK